MRETFRAFNGLRFIAAFMILCYHYLSETAGFAALPSFVRNIVAAGPVGLGFFFILSGFVLAHAYAQRVPAVPEKRHDFWFARVARLYPVYLLAFLLFAPMAYEKYLHHAVQNGVKTFIVGGVLNAFAVQAWTPYAQSWNGPSWSLSVEAFFYFIFPFVLVRFNGWRLRNLLSVLALLWCVMITITMLHETGYIAKPVWTSYIQNNPLFWTPLFLVGVAIYRLVPYWRKLSSPVASTVQAVLLLTLVVLCGVLNPKAADFMINGGVAPLLALLVLAFSHTVGVQSRAFGVRGLYELGGASYITYILQAPVWHIVLTILNKGTHRAAGAAPLVWEFLVYLAIILGVSLLIQAYFEKPAQQWLQERRASAKKQRQARTDLADMAIEAP